MIRNQLDDDSSDDEWIRPYTWFFIRYLYNSIKIYYQGSKHVKNMAWMKSNHPRYH
jgi:hypothetical protein